MLTSASASASSSTDDAKGLTHFTFWDVDDTLIVVLKGIFKNAHLLLPIMLYQTRAPNQHVGILTNRSSDEEVRSEFPVEICLQMLSGFGIDIPKAHVLFGGGEDNKLNVESHHQLSIATAQIIRHLEILKLSDHSDDVLQVELLAQQLATSIEPLKDVKHRGKNYFILKFLNEHLHVKSQEYRFDTGVCHKDNFICGIVDDKRGIPESAEALGKHFFGIKATDGGHPPKSEQDRPDFYQDGYLFELARKIGLDEYAKNLISNPEEHANDDDLLQLSGLLYAWHAFPKRLTIKEFSKFEYSLTIEESEQMANMLAYIKCHANQHKDAHYNSVDDLAECFKTFAVKQALIALNRVREQISASQLSTVSDSSAHALEPPAKGVGRLGMLFKSKSVGSSSKALAAQRVVEPAVATRLNELSQMETVLVVQLTHLQNEDNDGVRQPIRMALEKAMVRAQAAANPFNVLPSSSSSSGSRLMVRSAIPTSSSQDSAASPVPPVLIAPAAPPPLLISRSSSRSSEEDAPAAPSVVLPSTSRRAGSAIIGRRSGKK